MVIRALSKSYRINVIDWCKRHNIPATFSFEEKKFIYDKVMEVDLPWSEKDFIEFLRSERRDWNSFIKGKTKTGVM